MHTFNGEKTRIIHSDFHGECTIRNIETKEEISATCEDLLAFAAEYIRSERINALEQMDTEELLGISKVYKSKEINYKPEMKDDKYDSHRKAFNEIIEQKVSGTDYDLSKFNPASKPINTIVYGKTCSGKTTKLIDMINALLLYDPELRIGVCEDPQAPEIKTAVPSVFSIKMGQPLTNLDLIICTWDYHMCLIATNIGIPIWCEITADERNIEIIKENMPCITNFKYIHMAQFNEVL